MVVTKITSVNTAKARHIASFIKCLLNKINAFKIIDLRSKGILAPLQRELEFPYF